MTVPVDPAALEFSQHLRRNVVDGVQALLSGNAAAYAAAVRGLRGHETTPPFTVAAWHLVLLSQQALNAGYDDGWQLPESVSYIAADIASRLPGTAAQKYAGPLLALLASGDERAGDVPDAVSGAEACLALLAWLALENDLDVAYALS